MLEPQWGVLESFILEWYEVLQGREMLINV